MAEVEIIWPTTLAQTRLTEVADELESGGVATTCRIQPVRRGPETAVMVLMTTAVLEPFLRALFTRVGEEALDALRRFMGKLFGQRGPGEESAKDGPDVVIFESTTTGAQFLFTPRLPDDALRKALELDPGSEPGRWMWDEHGESWLRFETVSREDQTS